MNSVISHSNLWESFPGPESEFANTNTGDSHKHLAMDVRFFRVQALLGIPERMTSGEGLRPWNEEAILTRGA
jgi:hypothetical protein